MLKLVILNFTDGNVTFFFLYQSLRIFSECCSVTIHYFHKKIILIMMMEILHLSPNSCDFRPLQTAVILEQTPAGNSWESDFLKGRPSGSRRNKNCSHRPAFSPPPISEQIGGLGFPKCTSRSVAEHQRGRGVHFRRATVNSLSEFATIYVIAILLQTQIFRFLSSLPYTFLLLHLHISVSYIYNCIIYQKSMIVYKLKFVAEFH